MAIQSGSLTTRQRVIDFADLGTLTTTQGTVLDSIINATSDFVENYCQRTFKKTTYTNEEYDGQDSQFLVLKNFPVTTFTQLQERTGSSSWNTLSSTIYVVNLDTGVIAIDKLDTWRSTMEGSRFVDATQNYRVTYTAGYDFDNVTPGTTLEEVGLGDLEYAVWKLCVTAWEQRGGSSNIQSEKLGDYSVTYRKEVAQDTSIMNVLDKYVRESLV